MTHPVKAKSSNYMGTKIIRKPDCANILSRLGSKSRATSDYWRLSVNRARTRKEHQIGIGDRGKAVPGPFEHIPPLQGDHTPSIWMLGVGCSIAIAERSSSRRLSRYWSSSSVKWVLRRFW